MATERSRVGPNPEPRGAERYRTEPNVGPNPGPRVAERYRTEPNP